MRKLTICSVLGMLVLLGPLDIGDVPRIGNCRTMPNQAAGMTTHRWDGTVVLHAQEKITLAVPVFTSVGATDFRVWDLYMRRTHPDREAEVRTTFREVNESGFVPGGRSLECRYEGDVAETLVIGLNKANMSTKSLERRVTERCQVDKKLGAGTISGIPQEEKQ